MGRRPVTRGAASRGRFAGVAVTVAAVGLAVLGAAPFVAIEVARRDLVADPCVSHNAGLAAAPGPRFFSAHTTLDVVALLPAVGARASQVSTEAALQCLETYTTACSELRDAALAAVRSEGSGGDADPWETHLDPAERERLCARWQEFRDWLDAHGVDGAGACALCAGPA